ncbi:hypothetical protein O3P69_006432 [Scylla paramamosain]|uniref:RNA-directed DNA polymerase n=1 Tax=Scylla paramamosain TaxID=85552 RepID=A0AAW0U2D9_SCYPA
MFTFRIKYLKGDTNCAADALSRYPILSGEPERSDKDEEELVCAAMTAATVTAAEDEMGHVVDLRQVEEEAEQDEEYRLLRECVANDGWAERKYWEPPALRPYFRMRRHLSSQGSVVLYTCDEKHPRLVVPAALRRTVLANLHAGHQGRDSMLRRVRQSVYWPGIDAEVEQKRRQCAVCDTHAPSSPAESLMSSQGSVVLYTCDEKHPRLVVPAALRRTVLANLHAGHQGRDSMLRRARQSVYWPGIDAEVEQKRRQCAGSEASPAQLLTGRQLRDAIPVDTSLYEVSEWWAWFLRERERALVRSGDNAASRHNQSAHNLEPLTPGQRTHIQNPSSGRWDRAGTVLETTAPRQYLVRLDGSGCATIRNRRHLRPLTREPHTQASDDGAAAIPDPTPPTQRRPQRSRRAPRHLYDYILGDTTP